MKPTSTTETVKPSQKQLLSDVRELAGDPGLLLKSRIFGTYDSEDDFADWDLYPSWSFHPRFLSPIVQSELLVYDGEPRELLRCSPGLQQSRSARSDCYRGLLVPERLRPWAKILSGVADLHVLPSNLTDVERVDWFRETFENQSYQRILNLSSHPSGAWLMEMVRDVADFSQLEGLYLSGVKPVVKAGPGLYLYYRSIRWERPRPIASGPFHSTLFGVANDYENGGVNIHE